MTVRVNRQVRSVHVGEHIAVCRTGHAHALPFIIITQHENGPGSLRVSEVSVSAEDLREIAAALKEMAESP